MRFFLILLCCLVCLNSIIGCPPRKQVIQARVEKIFETNLLVRNVKDNNTYMVNMHSTKIGLYEVGKTYTFEVYPVEENTQKKDFNPKLFFPENKGE